MRATRTIYFADGTVVEKGKKVPKHVVIPDWVIEAGWVEEG